MSLCVTYMTAPMPHMLPKKIESRERRLSAFEEELKGEAAKKAQDVQALQRRLREEAKYQLDLDRLRTKELEEREKRLNKALQVCEGR